MASIVISMGINGGASADTGSISNYGLGAFVEEKG